MSQVESVPVPSFAVLHKAYWEWLNANCPFNRNKSAADAKSYQEWKTENAFPFMDRLWFHSAHPMRSNSGKTVVGWSTTYRATDGTVVADRPEPNRRSDPKRNWGLGRD